MSKRKRSIPTLEDFYRLRANQLDQERSQYLYGSSDYVRLTHELRKHAERFRHLKATER